MTNYDDWALNYDLPQCDDTTIACRQLEYCEELEESWQRKNCRYGRSNWCSATKNKSSFLYEDLDLRCNPTKDEDEKKSASNDNDVDQNDNSDDDQNDQIDPTPVNGDPNTNNDSCYVAINGFYFSCSGATPGFKIASSAAIIALGALILQ